MKKPILLVPFLALTFIGLQTTCRAQSSSGGPWEDLFNGKDLTGWRLLNGQHIFEAKDGMIVGTTVPGEPNGFLATEKEYGDFILELEVSIDTLMNNSGVQFRSLSTPDYQNGRVHGYQMEVDTKPQRWSGSIYDEGGQRGWIYTTELNPAGKNAFRNNAWNKYRIECAGTTMRTWVNGIPIAHLADAASAKGFIALQLHANNPTDPPGSHQVRFRNIRIQTTQLRLSPPDDIFVVNTIPNDLSLQEQKNGYTLLWDGQTTKGWKGARNKQFPTGSWQIKEGALTALPPGADILTKEQYGPFELKFDFRLTAGAESGVAYFVTSDKGLEYQIVDDERHPDAGVNSSHQLGSLYDILPAQKTRASLKKTGEWNQGLIRAFPNGHIEYWLNGYRILAFERETVMSKRPLLGHILLQGHGTAVSYRSIKIKRLN